jgi:DNA-binding response OmpR family regulator
MEEHAHDINPGRAPRRRKLVVVISSDRAFAESLRSNLARDFDVLLARDGGEAAAKSQAVQVDLALVDLGSPILGVSALGRMRGLNPQPIICALALPEGPLAQSRFDFDYVLARPDSGIDFPDRVRFILAKEQNNKKNNHQENN